MVSGVSGFSSFNAASMSEMRQKMFDGIDTDSDGSISNDEVAALVQQSVSDIASGLFSSLDSDGSSLISKIEFDASLSKLAQQAKGGDSGMPAMPPPPEKVFDTADANGNGSVTEEELAAVLGTDRAGKIFSEVDADGDGRISREEDEAFRVHQGSQRQESDPPGFASSAIGSSGQDWQSRMYLALLSGLYATGESVGGTTSLFT